MRGGADGEAGSAGRCIGARRSFRPVPHFSLSELTSAPPSRYSGALLLAYRQYQRTALERPLLVPDTRIVTVRNHEGNTETREVPLYPHLATPTLSMLFVTFFATLISIIAVVSASVLVSTLPSPSWFRLASLARD